MEIVVKGRNGDISDRFRDLVHDKLHRLEKFDGQAKINRVDVEVTHEKNPRQHDHAARVELTVVSKGPIIRAEASAIDQSSALDVAIDKLETRLRRAGDRKRIRRGSARRTPSLADLEIVEPTVDDATEGQEEDGPMIVRTKTHKATPMTLDQALYEMELVGHDFYLYVDAASHQPNVVYRRKGYDYGVISLEIQADS